MKFWEVLKKVTEDYSSLENVRFRRKSWQNTSYYITIENNVFIATYDESDGGVNRQRWTRTLTDEKDMLADDWEIVLESKSTNIMPFYQALQRLLMAPQTSRIRRKCWNKNVTVRKIQKEDQYIVCIEHVSNLINTAGLGKPYIPNAEDLVADDWEFSANGLF